MVTFLLFVARLLSSALCTTITMCNMERTSTVVVQRMCKRVPGRCTGCTSIVPPVNTSCGTPTDQLFTVVCSVCRSLYQVYHRFCVSFSNRPWTVVIESLFDSLNNRYKWYKDHETQLPHRFQLYHLTFVTGTPFTKKVANIRLSAVPLCTTNSDGKRSEAPWGALGSLKSFFEGFRRWLFM